MCIRDRGLDVARLAGVVADGGTQQANALDDGLRTDDEAGPDALHQLVVGDDVGSAARQRQQQVERQLGQRDLAAIAPQTLLADVELEVADAPDFVGLVGAGNRHPA